MHRVVAKRKVLVTDKAFLSSAKPAKTLISCQHGQRELALVGSTMTLSLRAVITKNVGRCP